MKYFSFENNLHEMSKPILWKENKENISKCLLKFLPKVQILADSILKYFSKKIELNILNELSP